MQPGDVVHDRYDVLAVAGEGGMGVVYRAQDRMTGERVALKHLKGSDEETVARFSHEAEVLARLKHPNIVRHVAHEVAPPNEVYLVMEWLEGERLDERLARGRLEIEECAALARAVAGALSAAHAQGIVHRDVKPNNVFLVDRRASGAKLLDFGIARAQASAKDLTRTGSAVGTPGYMSPEQASGERDVITPQSDVFSLGCVLFECLTGRPAFAGRHVMALLAKLLMEEPPSVRELRAEVPAALAALVGRMLSKDPAARPADGAAVIAELDAIERLGDAAPPPSTHPGVVTGHERRLVAVIALRPPQGEQVEPEAPTLPASGVEPTFLRAPLIARRAAAPFGAAIEELADGTVVGMLVGAGPATDQAAAAARCALQIQSRLPDAPIILLMGRSEDTRRLPVGEVLERAASMLDSAVAARRSAPDVLPPIIVDDVTRALLDVRFEVAEEAGRAILRGEREVGVEPRLLLGKRTPFVGRERELQNLLGLVEDSFEEERACAIVVTAPAGTGKSRLRQELVSLLRRRYPDLVSPIGRADSLGAGSTHAILASAFRGGLSMAVSEPVEERRRKLVAFTAMYIKDGRHIRVAELLGELIGTPFPDEASPTLRAARRSAAQMMAEVQAAYLDITRAVTAERPVLLVLEDLHWGDAASVKLVDAALRELADRRFVVIAFARPEVYAAFPRLWSSRETHQIRLWELHRKAAAALARSVLGGAIDGAAIEAVVERAAGNAFYLEELIRAVADGHVGSLPDTVLGMVEARLRGLEPAARRLLRAGSVFGEAFWRSGVLALLGEAPLRPSEPDPFEELCELELVVRRASSRFAPEPEYAFRHALLREGAYAMLPEPDRETGHLRAAEWLEAAGEGDLIVLAEHHQRGKDAHRAIDLYLRAGHNAQAAATGCAALRGFGIDLPAGEEERAAALELAMAEERADLLARPLRSRLDAPAMTDPTALAAERLLSVAALPAYFISPALYGLMMCAWLALLRRHGHSDISATAYVFYGAFLISVPGRSRDAYEVALAGMELHERRPSRAIACRLVETMAGNIEFAHAPVRDVLARFPDALRAGLETGDLLHATYVCGHLAVMRLFIGDELSSVLAEIRDNLAIVRRSRDLFILVLLHVCQAIGRELRGAAPADPDEAPATASGEWSDAALAELTAREDFATFGALYHTLRLLARAVQGDWAAALVEAEAAESKGPHAPGQFFAPQLELLGALAHLRAGDPHVETNARLASYRERLRGWADGCAATFLAGHLLVEAEIARASGDAAAARERYERAIEASRPQALTRDEALSCELYASFLEERGRADEARRARDAARRAYERWGALAKARSLA